MTEQYLPKNYSRRVIEFMGCGLTINQHLEAGDSAEEIIALLKNGNWNKKDLKVHEPENPEYHGKPLFPILEKYIQDCVKLRDSGDKRFYEITGRC